MTLPVIMHYSFYHYLFPRLKSSLCFQSIYGYSSLTAAIAATTGLVSGKVIALFGHRVEPYTDEEEFDGEAEEKELFTTPVDAEL